MKDSLFPGLSVTYNEEKWKPLQSYHDHNGFFGCKKDVLRIDTKSFINTNIIVKSQNCTLANFVRYTQLGKV